jgi:ABC-type nitrate/sulfonate/bicarbonate transport system ATPase subunit
LKLSLKDVSVSFKGDEGRALALDGVALDQEEGTVVMVVGPSGCGKSTLLNVVAGLIKPDSGSALFDGRPVTGPSPERSVIFQDGALFPWLTVRQNVEFGLKQAGVAKSARIARARTTLETVGLRLFENRPIGELSGGMRQRVAIARALVLEPEALLMDEPLSALDAITREDLYVELQRLWGQTRSTVLFVTHNVREAVVLGDRVVLMSPGPGRFLKDYEVSIRKPRRLDDAEVAALAKRISDEMKEGMAK